MSVPVSPRMGFPGRPKTKEVSALGDAWWVERQVFIAHIGRLEQRNALLQRRLDEAQAAIAKSMMANMGTT